MSDEMGRKEGFEDVDTTSLILDGSVRGWSC